MQMSVELMPPFAYSIWFLAIIVVLILIVVVVLWATREKKVVAKAKPAVVKTERSLDEIKSEYVKKLEQLEQEVTKMTVRKVHQVLSEIVRNFVAEVTGVKVQNYSLMEIKMLKMPEVEELVRTCYAPEFAAWSQGDAAAAIEKAKQIVRGWK